MLGGSYIHTFQHVQENKPIITNGFDEAGITDRFNWYIDIVHRLNLTQLIKTMYVTWFVLFVNFSELAAIIQKMIVIKLLLGRVQFYLK